MQAEKQRALIGTLPHKVLVVEDSSDMQELLQVGLTSAGFTVALAEDGVAALEVLETWMPDVILTDIWMPRMDGIALLRHIKRQQRFSHLPVIVLSASPRGADHAQNIGAACVLRKPIDFSDLVTALRGLLNNQAAYAVVLPPVDDS